MFTSSVLRRQISSFLPTIPKLIFSSNSSLPPPPFNNESRSSWQIYQYHRRLYQCPKIKEPIWRRVEGACSSYHKLLSHSFVNENPCRLYIYDLRFLVNLWETPAKSYNEGVRPTMKIEKFFPHFRNTEGRTEGPFYQIRYSFTESVGWGLIDSGRFYRDYLLRSENRPCEKKAIFLGVFANPLPITFFHPPSKRKI